MRGVYRRLAFFILMGVAAAGIAVLPGALARATDTKEVLNKTRAEAAVWVCREMEKRGEGVQEELLERIREDRRISDLGQIKKKNQEEVLLAYHWGIMGGFSNGAYSKNRRFLGNQKITKKEWTEIKKRIENPKKRFVLSPDGQLCRTTRLPANSKKFPYILDSYPNSYYEGTFDYEWYEGKLKEGGDYINPSGMADAEFTNWKTSYPLEKIRGEYEKAWKQCIRQNLETRLNVDYRKIDRDYHWLNRLRNTYFISHDPEQDLKITKEIEDYIEKVKKNQVIIKGTVDLDSSTLYKSLHGYFMRTHIKFKIVSANQMPAKQTDLIFGEHIYFKGLKKGVWKEAVVDIGLGSANPYSDGRDFAVIMDNLTEPLKK